MRDKKTFKEYKFGIWNLEEKASAYQPLKMKTGVVYSNWFQAEKFNLKVDYFDKHLSVALDETTTTNVYVRFREELDKSLRKIKGQPIEYITTN